MSSRTDEHAAEVFPWMEHAIVIGALLGAVVAIGLRRANHLEPSGVFLGGLFGAAAGAAVGTCLALRWARETPARPTRPLSADSLWDPWLDAAVSAVVADRPPTHPSEEVAFEIAGRVNRARARVKPRAIAAATGEALPLEDLIGPILAGAESGAIRISGRSGGGKTTALAHLSGLVPPHLRVSFLEDPRPRALASAVHRGWAIFTSDDASLHNFAKFDLRLAPWGEGESIEYLLATDRRLCASVMTRLGLAKPETARLEGIPELWRIVLDRMIADPSLPGPRSTLKRELAALMPDDGFRYHIESACYAAIAKNDLSTLQHAGVTLHDQALFRLLRHRPVQLLLAADSIVAALKNRAESAALGAPLPRDLVLETVTQIAGDTDLVDRLRSLIKIGGRKEHPMVASLLHALRLGWTPDRPLPRLAGAYLEDAPWPDIDLAGADLRDADLSGANLRGSRLDSAILEAASLVGADLFASSMKHANFDRADLSRASLSRACARQAVFQSTRLVAANMVGGEFDRANFDGADLTHARLTDASLVGADFRSAKLEESDFSRANLSEAIMRGLTLTAVQLAGACFTRADLSRCNLEGINLRGAGFARANLAHALLTGSQMPGADFRGANLRAAGLAEIDWEGADLRGADLREATFHLGSSRSGLVGSPIASEGSRTGFYTDDWNEQDFKSPEEIRKANLCGADLRGARIDNVDFYLVDLRGASFDPKQIAHLRKSGAILEARA
jgi:uncharacterized protein YjbI with pentapeptide repeats